MNNKIQDIINDVHNQISQNPKLLRELLSITDKDSLIQYHHSLGRVIRNQYNLWTIPWTPELDEDGVDCSPYHPDQVSQTIIEKVWELIKQSEEQK